MIKALQRHNHQSHIQIFAEIHATFLAEFAFDFCLYIKYVFLLNFIIYQLLALSRMDTKSYI